MSNIVKISDHGTPVTTSLAIAEGVGSAHKAVIQLVRNNISDFNEFERVAFEMRPFDTSGGVQNREVAILNEQHATLLMTYMRNSDVVKEFKKRLVKEFYALAQQRRSSVSELSRMDILQMAIQSEQERLALVEKVEQDRPHVEFAKQVEAAPDAIKVSEAAKILGTGRQRLFAFLRQNKWVTRKNEPYQSKIEQGYLDVKLSTWTHPNHGLQQSVTAIVTGKGLSKLQSMWSSDQVAA